MVKLAEKIASVTSDELSTLLNLNATVSISWWGKRVVSIEDHDGAVAIDTITRKYLSFPSNARSLTGRIDDLYKQSDEKLKKTWIYWLIVRVLEWAPHSQLCRALLEDRIPQTLFSEPSVPTEPSPMKPSQIPVKKVESPTPKESPKTPFTPRTRENYIRAFATDYL